jgi:hypothetical protein
MNDEPHAQIRQMQAQIRERTAAATREARAAPPFWKSPWMVLAISSTVPGIVLAFLGPFGSFQAPLWMRFAYWLPTMAIGACAGAALTVGFERSSLLKDQPLARSVVLAAVMTAIMTFVAWGFGQLIFGPGAIDLGLQFVFYVFLITVVMMAVSTVAIERAQRVATASCPAPATAPGAPPALLARLPDKLKSGAILALQGEDHYVRVHTDAGSDLILMRLGDAIAGMGDTPGARTHRSWWVSKGAVKTPRRDNGRTSLILSNGLEVPVSRGYASELKDAGWFDT